MSGAIISHDQQKESEDVSQYIEYEDILGKIKDDRYIS